MRTHTIQPKGFTLIEILVSVAIFATVMVIALGALLSMSESDRKAQSLKSVVNNLNFTLDAMSRSMRTGTTYYCGVLSYSAALPGTQDCASTPSTGMAFRSADGQVVKYCRGNGNACSTSGTAVLVSKNGAQYAPLTATEVVITNLQFYVTGAQGATVQPYTRILLSGRVPVSVTQTSTFDLQTSVTQRLFDQ